jgi:hypothetical protein
VTLSEAKRRVWACRVLGSTLIVVAFLAAVLVVLKYFYIQIPVRKLHDSINQILWTSPILSFIWSLLPTGDNHHISFLLLMICAFWAFIGVGIVRYANNLNGRIRSAKHDIEKEQWRRSLGQIPANVGVLSIQSIQLASEEYWYKRPWGLLLIGLVINVIAGLLLKLF